MGRLIKYEFKGNYKLFLGLFGIVALLYTVALTRVNSWAPGSIMALMSVITVAMYVAILIFVVNSFRNELYEDRGYLTFTLPVKGVSILGSKLITGIIWTAIATVIALIFAKISSAVLFDPNELQQFSQSIGMYINTKAIFLVSTLMGIINLVMLLLLIYFSITLTRVAKKGKKLSGFIGFLVFIALNIVIFYIEYKLMVAFPQTLSMELDFLANSSISGNVGFMMIDEQAIISLKNSALNINIAGIIYNIVVYVGLFLSTSYFIDNKVEI